MNVEHGVEEIASSLSRHFDAHAASIIDRCFDNDENFAVDIVKRPAASFYDIHPLQLAQKSDSRSFLASKCVQRHLDNTWWELDEIIGY